MARRGRGWHGERARHSAAARKSTKRRPVQVIDRDVLSVMREIRALKEKRRKSDDVEMLSILNEQIRLKEEFIKGTLPRKQVELMVLEAV